MSRQIEQAIVRIMRADGTIFGAGSLVSSNQILTCAHVVADSLGIPRDTLEEPTQTVFLDFPLLTPRTNKLASIVRYWSPADDIALLELIEETPTHARRLDLADLDDYGLLKFGVCGFPRGKDGGDWTYGTMLGRTAQGYVQVEAETAHRVQGGYSGSPAWNATEGVAGMVVASDEREPQTKTAYVIPASTILNSLPHLREIQRPPRSFRYACFISFPPPQGNIIRPAVEELREDLLGEIQDQIDKDVFVDFGRLEKRYDEAVAIALCESSCMIMVYTQRYFDPANLFCAREFRAMEMLEKERLQAMNLEPSKDHCLIIPIAVRGFNKLPPELCTNHSVYNFEKYFLMSPSERRRRWRGDIAAIARHIADQSALLDLYLANPCGQCRDYQLPHELEIQGLLASWLPQYVI
jgi:hypothetical protein